jgi:hypothetical protein
VPITRRGALGKNTVTSLRALELILAYAYGRPPASLDLSVVIRARAQAIAEAEDLDVEQLIATAERLSWRDGR